MLLYQFKFKLQVKGHCDLDSKWKVKGQHDFHSRWEIHGYGPISGCFFLHLFMNISFCWQGIFNFSLFWLICWNLIMFSQTPLHQQWFWRAQGLDEYFQILVKTIIYDWTVNSLLMKYPVSEVDVFMFETLEGILREEDIETFSFFLDFEVLSHARTHTRMNIFVRLKFWEKNMVVSDMVWFTNTFLCFLLAT